MKGDPADKEYQKQIINKFIFMVYIYDDETIKTIDYLDLGVDKNIEKIRLDETNELIERIKRCSNTVAHSQANPDNHYGVWSFIIGFVLMLILDVALG